MRVHGNDTALASIVPDRTEVTGRAAQVGITIRSATAHDSEMELQVCRGDPATPPYADPGWFSVNAGKLPHRVHLDSSGSARVKVAIAIPKSVPMDQYSFWFCLGSDVSSNCPELLLDVPRIKTPAEWLRDHLIAILIFVTLLGIGLVLSKDYRWLYVIVIIVGAIGWIIRRVFGR